LVQVRVDHTAAAAVVVADIAGVVDVVIGQRMRIVD
jgi:hypothetical protein